MGIEEKPRVEVQNSVLPGEASAVAMAARPGSDGVERGFLVGVELKRRHNLWRVEDSLDELAQLARTAGIEVVGRTYQRLDAPRSATYIGSGKVEELELWKRELDYAVVVFDDELSPRQQRNLEDALEIKILDRTALILDIFAGHARTREGKLQVELAQYEYRLPRLTRMWTHLVRQAGGAAGRGGISGVGLRGPGETQLETDRREIGRRIAHLKRELEKVRVHREHYRRRRRQSGIPVVSIVGYTNAGKSTLLNALSGADVLVEDKLFATLDPTTRRVRLPEGKEVLFTDTVGFIQKLPTQLVAAFRATLEEITEADLLLHIVDITHPQAREQVATVWETLEEIGVGDTPEVLALNKVDRLLEDNTYGLKVDADMFDRQELILNLGVDPAGGDAEGTDSLAGRHTVRRASAGSEGVPISAEWGIGLERLLKRVEAALNERLVPLSACIPYAVNDLVSLWHQRGFVESEEYTEKGTVLTGKMPRQFVWAYEPYITGRRVG